MRFAGGTRAANFGSMAALVPNGEARPSSSRATDSIRDELSRRRARSGYRPNALGELPGPLPLEHRLHSARPCCLPGASKGSLKFTQAFQS